MHTIRTLGECKSGYRDLLHTCTVSKQPFSCYSVWLTPSTRHNMTCWCCRAALHGAGGPLRHLIHQLLAAGQRSMRLMALVALHLAALFMTCPPVALLYQDEMQRLLLCGVTDSSLQVPHRVLLFESVLHCRRCHAFHLQCQSRLPGCKLHIAHDSPIHSVCLA